MQKHFMVDHIVLIIDKDRFECVSALNDLTLYAVKKAYQVKGVPQDDGWELVEELNLAARMARMASAVSCGITISS